MNTYPKRLIEVDLPIKSISAHARREKSIRHGHISTLHIWWARRPLAACRAVLCAALWIDPADPFCPPSFREAAFTTLRIFSLKANLQSGEAKRNLVGQVSENLYGHCAQIATRDYDLTNDEDLISLRRALLAFIADFANWDNSTQPDFLETARDLTQSAHEALGGVPGTRPLVADPFAGGGAIPLEALRVGADVFASDLNPVAVLLNKVVLEYIPRYGQQLADEVRKWGTWIKEQAEQELAEFYPKDDDGATPIAYLWARTITCEGPNCGCEVPLMRSFWLAKKANKAVAVRLIQNLEAKRVDFEIIQNASGAEFNNGTVKRGSATCPCCGFTTPVEHVRAQLKLRKGGAADARLFAVVTTHTTEQGRFYRLPMQHDLDGIRRATKELERRKANHKGLLSLVPDEPLDVRGIRHTWAMIYGLDTWNLVFTPRQALVLSMLSQSVQNFDHELNGDSSLTEAVQTCLAIIINRQANTLTSLSRWNLSGEKIEGIFARQAIALIWDFVEGNPFSGSTGDFDGALDWVVKFCAANTMLDHQGQAEQASATSHLLPDDSVQVLFTDPPYYDAVPYAYLSDFFYVWFRRTLGSKYSDLLKNPLVPKDDEIVVDRPHELSTSNKDVLFYERELTKAFTEIRRILQPNGIGSIVFASKSTSSWEAILKAVVEAGWTITASWAIDTEMAGRVAAQGQARLASSIHVVCRPRENADGTLRGDIGDWRDVLVELPPRIHEWLPRLEREGVVGADAIFACLGPAMEIYSRYARVEKASGDVVALHEYLEQVWAVVSREALNVIFEGVDTTGFEEDARLTVIWFWSLQTGETSNGENNDDEEVSEESDETSEDEKTAASKKKLSGYSMEYDTARKIAQGLGADLRLLSRPGGIVVIKGNIAALNHVRDREDYLIGVQLSLFGDDLVLHHKRHAKPKDARVDMKAVSQRELIGFEKPTPITNTEQTQLPGFTTKLNDQRSFMERLIDAGETVLDRLHQAMLLHGNGQTALLGMFLTETGMGSDQRFWRLADALLRLYPKGTEEYRWLDGVLARKKGLGF